VRGRIPEEILVELRDRANIVEVVGAQVGLKRVGRNHVGLCPFHAEKTPSFTVNDERGIFHCFGCGAGGNVFTFLMKMENLTFPDIVERLARRYGVTLPERGDDDPAIRRREALYRLNEKTARFFERYLWDAAEAEPARAYLASRGIGRETAERFVLGYAPAGGEVLVRRLRDAGAGSDPELGAAGRSLALGEDLGLVLPRRNGSGHFDRFRARLMFPITDSAGRVVGFGSRSVPGTPSAEGDLPKYLNSPETPLYKKGAHLYGLATAKEAIRKADQAVVVEGYFDVLAPAEAGLGYVVASLGTALTVEQAKLLARFTTNVVVCFDGDAAGQRAAEKSLTTFLDAGLWGRGAFLPPGDDPDTFVQREGLEAATKLVEKSIPLLEFYLDRALPPESTDADRVRVAKQMAPLLRKIRGPLELDMAIRQAGSKLGAHGHGEEMLRREILAASDAPAARPASVERRTPIATDRRNHVASAEELLVTLMLHDPSCVLRIDGEGALDLFDEGPWRSLAVELVDGVRRGVVIDPATLLGRLDESDAARIAGRLLAMGGEDATREQILVDCIANLRHRARERERLRVLRQIREDEARGNDAAVAEGQRQLQELRQLEANERG
jgi:DNA primase